MEDDRLKNITLGDGANYLTFLAMQQHRGEESVYFMLTDEPAKRVVKDGDLILRLDGRRRTFLNLILAQERMRAAVELSLDIVKEVHSGDREEGARRLKRDLTSLEGKLALESFKRRRGEFLSAGLISNFQVSTVSACAG